MAEEGDRLGAFIRSTLRSAGRQLSAASRAFEQSRRATEADLPSDETGEARIVCRRYAERRSVGLDAEARPACFDPEHPDCQGCVEDIHADAIETW